VEETNDLLQIISTLWKKRKVIIYTTILATIIAIIAALTLDNYYAASTSFYAASQDLAKPAPIGNQEQNINYYGQDTDLDRLFSIARSNQLKQHLIQKFDLYDNYEIKKDKPKSAHKLNLKLSKLYKTIKTEYDALELIVEDKDPQMAMEMANSAREKISELARGLVKESQNQSLTSMHQSIESKEKELSAINDSLNRLKKRYDIIDMKSQGELLVAQKGSLELKYGMSKAKMESLEGIPAYQDSVAYLKSLTKGLESQLNKLNESLTNFNRGFNIIAQLDRERAEFANQISVDRQRLNQMKASVASDFATLHIVEKATIPVVKSRPKRSLYVMGATLFTFVFMSITVLVLDAYKKVNWNKVLSD